MDYREVHRVRIGVHLYEVEVVQGRSFSRIAALEMEAPGHSLIHGWEHSREAMVFLRQLRGQFGGSVWQSETDAVLFKWFRGLVASGNIEVRRIDPNARLSPEEAVMLAAQGVAEGEPYVPPPRPPKEVLLHWIEIELVGEDDEPIPDEAYEIILPDGGRVSGTLNGEGFARVADIAEPGTCKVCFPALDGKAWTKIATLNAKF